MTAYRSSIKNRAARLAALLYFFALGPLLLPGASPAVAAGFAEDHTILYYLIEMQRRANRTCGGERMPEAPSLMPSESLRRLAALSASSGQPAARIAEKNGLAGIPFLATTARGTTPRQIFEALVSGQCSAIMNPAYQYIGASGQDGLWTLIMAAAEPGTVIPRPLPALPPALPEGETAAPELTAQIGSQTPVAPEPPAPEFLPLIAEPPAPASTVTMGGHQINPESEFAPATPIPVQEFLTDGRGRILPSDMGTAPPAELSGAAGTGPPLVRGPGPVILPPPAAAPVVAPIAMPQNPPRPGVVPLEDTRPPEAILHGDTTFLTPQPAAPPAPAAPVVQPGASAAPAVTMPIRTTPSTARASTQEAHMLDLINAARAQGRACGGTAMPPAPPLRGNAMLDASAREHTGNMVSQGFFSSTTPDGRNLGTRITWAGYAWDLVAENLLAGRTLADEAVGRWLGNESQCRNLMDGEFVDIGIGFDPAGPFWSVIVAAPFKRPEPPEQP